MYACIFNCTNTLNTSTVSQLWKHEIAKMRVFSVSLLLVCLFVCLFVYQDGRLQPGDQLVAINGQSVVRLEPGAVVKVLKESRSMGPTLKLVVARAVTEMANKKEGEEEEEVEDEIASDSDVSVLVGRDREGR